MTLLFVCNLYILYKKCNTGNIKMIFIGSLFNSRPLYLDTFAYEYNHIFIILSIQYIAIFPLRDLKEKITVYLQLHSIGILKVRSLLLHSLENFLYGKTISLLQLFKLMSMHYSVYTTVRVQ